MFQQYISDNAQLYVKLIHISQLDAADSTNKTIQD